MFSLLSRSWQLVRESFTVLEKDKEILLFPLVSGIALVLLAVSFILPVIFSAASSGITVALAAWFFVLYYIASFIVIFFNTGLVTCAKIRLTGGDPMFSDGIRNAVRHLPSIIVWAAIAATVGLVLRLISERSGLIGKIVVGIIGVVWSLITYFVIPVLVFEEKGVIDSIKASASYFRKTWGETVIGQVSIGLIFFLLLLAGAVPVILTLFAGNMTLFVAVSAVFIVYALIVLIISSALQGIFSTALYLYASTGKVPTAFTPELVANAFAPKGGHGNI
ncbi:MAG: DUF6159 family protein [Methanoregulaceae archaeon]|nr:DUF6159 family protein [Methanoregulaceae archaeon]